MLRYVGDFETTVFEGQERTDVWASALVPLLPYAMEDKCVRVDNNIADTFRILCAKCADITIYYHNLKFDGSFWLAFFNEIGAKQAFAPDPSPHFLERKEMPTHTYTYLISERGVWYNIVYKTRTGHILTFLDSMKLIPLSVKEMGKAFNTRHRKSEIDYKGFRYPSGVISPDERAYIANDVLVVAEALLQFFAEGHAKTTIGACCMAEWENTQDPAELGAKFGHLVGKPFPGEGYPDYDTFIRAAYRGGWCYLAEGKANKVYNNGITLDVNSLYPSVMHSASGNLYPVGRPRYFKGLAPVPFRDLTRYYYFVHIKCAFEIKRDFLPFIQIKNSELYPPREMLKSSDIFYKGVRYDKYRDERGGLIDARANLVMTCTDFQLFQEHYDLRDLEIIETVVFHAEKGMFDAYINKYYALKRTATGGRRAIAKLFLNNLYGKMATSSDSSFKVAYFENGLHFYDVHENTKTPGYIPIGAAITSYARAFTIRAAQANYHGADRPGFIYSDTDSIHLDLPVEEILGVEISSTDMLKWKLEGEWTRGWFVRPKTYIEEINGEWAIACAGMPRHAKAIFEACCGRAVAEDFAPEELSFIANNPKKLEDFTFGLKIPGKLVAKQIDGGTLLIDTTFEMR